MPFEMFLSLDISSQLCWVSVLFFVYYFPLWFLVKYDGYGVLDREWCGLAGAIKEWTNLQEKDEMGSLKELPGTWVCTRRLSP